MKNKLKIVFKGKYRNSEKEILIQAFTEDYKIYYIEAVSTISYTSLEISFEDFRIGTDKWDIILFEQNLKEKLSLKPIEEFWDKKFLKEWKKGRI